MRASPCGVALRVAALPAALRSPCARRCSAARRAAPTPRALFGPSKEEQTLRLKLEDTERLLVEAVRRAAEASADTAAERARADKLAEEVKMYAARLKESEKDVFKLERKVEEADKAFVSYQITAERQIELMDKAMKKAGVTL